MSKKWLAGLDDKEKKVLEAETKSASLVFDRLLDIINRDLYVSIKKMRSDEIASEHSLLVRELGTQAYAESLIEMINQIKGKDND